MDPAIMRLAIAWCTLFVIGTDLFVVSPLLPLIGTELQLEPAVAGLSLTAFAVTYMTSAPLMGYVADRVGRRQVMMWALTGFAVANLFTAAASSLAWLVTARIAAGAMAAGVSPSVYALVAEGAPRGRRATWLAVAVSGLLVSLPIGASIGGLLGTLYGWDKVFDLLAGLASLLVLANRQVWRTDLPSAAPPMLSASAAPAQLWLRLLPTVIWSASLYGMYTYLGSWLTRLGFSTAEIAEVLVFYGFGALIGALAGGRIADAIGSRAATSASLLGLFFGFMLLPLTIHPGMCIALAFGLTSAVAQVFFPAQQAALAADFPTRRATVLAWNNSSLFFGIGLGSLIGGQAMAHISFATSLVVCAAIALAGCIVNWAVAPRSALQRS